MRLFLAILLFVSLLACKKQQKINAIGIENDETTEFVDGKGVKLIMNGKGIITSAQFPDSLMNVTYDAYLRDYLKISADDSFVKEVKKQRIPGYTDDHYDQYYKGVRVDKAGYNFHFKNDQLYLPMETTSKSEGLM